ncbi:major facilitator superfamily domain-containing protein [Chytriomyces cf. hyalinus JEL632]|nr:major facilitator superfamily domain-containing protein [Chytriomyces cf. hyalinus JEL632]
MGLGFRRMLALPADAKILFATRAVRMFAYGLLGLLLVLYMKKLDLRDDDIGAFLMLTLLGDCAVSLLVASNADKMGRRFMLSLGAASMACTGIMFAIVPTFGAFNKWFTGRSEEESDLPADLNAVQGWIYFSILLVIGVVGVISPSGTEVGPFQAIEQSLLVKFIPFEHRATLFAWYTLFGSVMTALGSLLAGFVVSYLTERDFSALAGTYHNISMAALTFGSNMSRTKVYETKNQTISDIFVKQQVGDGNDGLFTKLEAYRYIVFAYGVVGILLLASFRLLSKDMEVEPEIPSESPVEEANDEVLEDDQPSTCATESQQTRGLMRIASFGSIFRARNTSSAESSPLLGGQRNTTTSFVPGLNLSPQTRWTVLKLCMLFTLDSFGSSIMNGGMLAYWFSYRFQVDEAYLGKLLFGSNVLCGVSALLAGVISQRVGLVNTMVFTHLPSNLIMMMVPFAHNLYWATTLVFIRALISQMDVGPRTAFISSIVPANERTSVIGLITTVRTLGAAFGPFLTGFMAEQGWFDAAFLLSGGLSALYDLLLLFSFGGKERSIVMS